MNCKNELVIRIQPDEHRIQVSSTDQGVNSVKEITTDTFLDCIRHSLCMNQVSSEFLPRNCFHVNIFNDKSREYCVWHSELYEDISYYGTEYPHFPLPRLVFSFRVSKEGKVSCCRLGVVKDEPLKETTPMYVYPFSNVAGFSLCTGNNALPVYAKAHTLATLPGFLLRLPNNNDSYREKNNKLNLPYRELLEHLKRKDPSYYYSDILIPNQLTVTDFINGR